MSNGGAVEGSNGMPGHEEQASQQYDADQAKRDADDRDHRMAEVERQLASLLERHEKLGKTLEEIKKMLAARREAKYGEITGG